jgi:hypothetical protein
VPDQILGLKWRHQATRQLEQGDGTARAGGRGAGEHGKHTSALSFMRTTKFFKNNDIWFIRSGRGRKILCRERWIKRTANKTFVVRFF